MRTDALDYDLPKELIAQSPLSERDASRLLVVDRGGAAPLEHRGITDLPELVPEALFVFNDTRVFPARLRGHKATGGKVEFLLLEKLPVQPEPPRSGASEAWVAMGRANKGLRAGQEITIAADLLATVTHRRDNGHVELILRTTNGSVAQAIEAHGEVPLPPYIQRDVAQEDRRRYQTVFAREAGAVAAPTAGLHFTDALLDALTAAGHRQAFVTLHVGPGTFQPVKAEHLDDHPMHHERYDIPEATVAAIRRAKATGRPVIAVGTTVVRTLEASAAKHGEPVAGSDETALFIRPPFEFRVIDGLLTNFHLPQSTLLALVMALAGQDNVRRAYREAVAAKYRFFSYGDAMLIRPVTR